MSCSRRTLLKITGLGLSSGGLTSIAGCVSSSTRSDNPQDDSPSPTPLPQDDQSDGTSMTDFKQWLPDPMTSPLRDGYGVRHFDIARIRALQDALHDNAYERLETEMLSPVPREFVNIDDVDASLQIDHIMRAVLGSFDPETFGENLTSDRRASITASARPTETRTPWPAPERYQGFDLYGTESVYAVSEDAIMEVSPLREGDEVEYAKAIIDAQAEQTSHYADSNEYVAAMFGLIDDPDAVWCYPEAMDGTTKRGFRKDVITGSLTSWRFTAETTHLLFADTYPDPEAAERGDLKNYIDSESDRFGPYDGLDVKTEGRLVWTEGTIPTNEFDFLSAGGPGDSVDTPN